MLSANGRDIETKTLMANDLARQAPRSTVCWMFAIIFLIQSDFCIAKSFISANAPGAIGETGSLYLLDRGVFARPFYNDVFGKTDKQLSGATQIGYLRPWSDGSIELRSHWRLITPSFKEKFADRELEAPVGRYADWMELSLAWSQTFETQGQRWRMQLSTGFGKVGDHGGKELHRKFHRLIGSSLEGLEYKDQPLGSEISIGAELGLIDHDSQFFAWKKESMLTIGFAKNKFMTEAYLTHNQVISFDEDFKLGLELRTVRQVASEVYRTERLDWRYELAVGLRWKWYRPSIKFVSPYLRGDQVGQMYFDPLAFVIQW